MRVRNTIALCILAVAGFSSCTSTKQIVDQTKIEDTAMKSTIEIPYFKAIGTEPFWSVEVSEKQVKFTDLDNQKGIIFPNDGLDMLEENMKLSFSNKTHMISINAVPGDCSDGMSDKRFSHKVHVSLISEIDGTTKEYNGCAEFFAAPQLTAVWTLQTMRGQEVSTKDFGNQIPFLEFFVEKNMFSGYAGCNQVTGQIKANTQNRIELSNIASTRMMCEPENKEQQFLNILAKVGAYKFDGDTLILLDPTYVPVATFKKK